MGELRPDQFLGLPSAGETKADSIVMPLPFERTVSYGRGTAGAPLAILEASCQVETFDEETGVEFSERPRLHTLPPLEDTGEPVARYLRSVTESARSLRDRFILGLGGEHLVTYGLVKGLATRLEDLTVIQIDAHADLADELDGLRWSHGTVMKRLVEEGCRLVQLGVRSLSRPEYELSRSHDRIRTFYAHELGVSWDHALALIGGLTGEAYLTVDVDGLDPSLVPATGTPQPDGLSWRQTMDVLRCVSQAPRCRLVGADLVEFVPSPNPPGCDIIVARLAAKILAFWHRRPGSQVPNVV